MPILKSAIKANKQTKTRTIRNQSIKKKYNELRKAFEIAISNVDAKEAQGILAKLYKALDLIGKKNIFHQNKSNRLKSQAAKKLAGLNTDKDTTKAPVAKKTTKKAEKSTSKKA